MAVTLQGSTLNNIHIGNSGGGASGGGASVGTFASRPAAGTAGRIYIATDSPIAQWVDDGSAWRPLIEGQVVGTQAPAASALTTFNLGSTTVQDNNGVVSVDCPTGSGASNVRGAAIAVSGASAYVQAAMCDTSVANGSGNSSAMIVFLRESSTGKGYGMTFWRPRASGAIPSPAYMQCSTINNNVVSAYTREQPFGSNGPHFVRVYLSGTDVVIALSRDGVQWKSVNQAAKSSIFSSGPDQAAFGIVDYGVSSCNVLSFSYGSL